MAPSMSQPLPDPVPSPSSRRLPPREQPQSALCSSVCNKVGNAAIGSSTPADSPFISIQDPHPLELRSGVATTQLTIDDSSRDSAAAEEPTPRAITGIMPLDKARLLVLYALASVAGLVTLGLCIAWPQVIFCVDQSIRMALLLVNAGAFLTCPAYFQFTRRAVFPFRLVCMHLLQEVIAAEAKEGDKKSWVMQFPQAATQSLEEWSRSHLKKSQRNTYKRARTAYTNSKVRHCTKSTSSVSPIEHSRIIWLHQCRKSSSPVLEFLERWGLLFMFDGTLDEFYIDDRLVAFSVSAQAGNSYQYMLYFSADQAARCGIYHYCTLMSVSRALNDPSVDTICAASGTDKGKKDLGYAGMTPSKMSHDKFQAVYGCRQSLFFAEVKKTKSLWCSADNSVWQ